MNEPSLNGIAIIGMVGRFPGAPDVDSFWEMIRDGREGITFFTAEELIESGISPKLVNHPNYVRARGMLPDVDRFDARFFGFSPREAEILDPQQRFFLECCAAVLEAGGYTAESAGGAIGVFGGSIGTNVYLVNNLLGNQELRDNVGDYPIFIANDKDSLTTRVAYKLNLRGPAITVQTACSTGLVAVATACQSLVDFQCDMALAGGVAITVPQKTGYMYTPGLVVSPDGHCRAFDAKAQGTLTSSGIGVVLLKRLEDAVRDRDPIAAVIRGWALNNDGADKVGYTAPSVRGQAECITQALASADIDPDSIGYVEAHGTGTPVGDPIEVAALTQAFRLHTKRRGFCAIGSVKTNVGHLETAAGIAGLIKAAQAVQHGQIPPSLHFETANPEIDFESSPFYVNTQLRPWPSQMLPRRAGVSSLGVGGTNAHVVLEQAPPLPEVDAGRTWKLVMVSARSRKAIESAAEQLEKHLAHHPTLDLADVAYTLQVGRRAHAQRMMAVCSDTADAIATLRGRDPQRVFSAEAEAQRSLVFMFTGQGSQYVNMCRGLYEQERVFREQVDLCCEYLRAEISLDLRACLFPAEAQREQAAHQLMQTAVTQPALFVIEYALSRLWMSLGLQPAAMIGHSIGEYVAACLSGVMSLRDAISIVAQRGWLMQQMPPGAMVAVPFAEDQARKLLNPDLSLAAINGPSHCVMSGTPEAIDALQRHLAAQGLRGRRLHTSHAFHSAMMDPMLARFTTLVRRIQLKPPKIPYISNVSGHWITPQEATDPAYYARQLRSTVRFSPGLELLLSESDRVLLEVGPGATLGILARQHPDPTAKRIILSSLRGEDGPLSDQQCFLSTLGRLWLAGCSVDWSALYKNERRRRVPLPTYPFERERFWVEPTRKSADGPPKPTPTAKVQDADKLFYKPTWRSVQPAEPALNRDPQSYLLFANDHPLCGRVARRLRQQGHALTLVRLGTGFSHDRLDEYAIHPTLSSGYERILDDLKSQGRSPRRLVHMWNIGGDHVEPSLVGLATSEDLAYHSLVTLAQVIGQKIPTEPLLLSVITTGVFRVDAEEAVPRPDRALVAGPCKVIPVEYRNITCQHIDFDLSTSQDALEDGLAERLLAEWCAAKPDPAVAYRELQRFVLQYRPMRMPRPTGELPRLRHGGAYLITGGLGGIGQALAEYLARSYRAKLLLTSRVGLPSNRALAQAAAAMANDERSEAIERRLKQVEALERLGAEVMIATADVSDATAMEAATQAAVARFGPIRGIIHAAGVPGGGVIQRRTQGAAAAVLSPKVRGTLVLDALFKKRDLDFFLLCSSLNSVLGGFGQADYTAANAFQDAFASFRSGRSRGLTVAVNWDAWREVGMAVDGARKRRDAEKRPSQQTSGNSQYRELAHPLFQHFMRNERGDVIYVTRIGSPRTWMLHEHRLEGRPTLPGTAYLELARAAYELHISEIRPVELRDVVMMAPLSVVDGRERDVRTVLHPIGNSQECDFSILSRPDPDRDFWQEHARGRIASLAPTPPTQHDIERLMSETPLIFNINGNSGGSAQRPLEFGPRWQNIVQVRFGRGQALAFIKLPDAFLDDLDMFMLHPALFDSATGFVAVRSATHYLPYAYRKVRILRPLRQAMYSYAAFEQSTAGGRESMHINLTIMDAHGGVLIEVEDYVVVKVAT